MFADSKIYGESGSQPPTKRAFGRTQSDYNMQMPMQHAEEQNAYSSNAFQTVEVRDKAALLFHKKRPSSIGKKTSIEDHTFDHFNVNM